MRHEIIQQDVFDTARNVGSANPMEDMFDTQMSYYLSIQKTMTDAGFDLVKKRFAGVTEELAIAIAEAKFHQLKNMCNSHFCTLQPSVSADTLVDLLQCGPQMNNSKAMLQALTAKEDV